MITELNEFDGNLLTCGGQTFGPDLHPGVGAVVEVSPAVYAEQMARRRDAIDPLADRINAAITDKVAAYDKAVETAKASRHGGVSRPLRLPRWADVLTEVRRGTANYPDVIVLRFLS